MKVSCQKHFVSLSVSLPRPQSFVLTSSECTVRGSSRFYMLIRLLAAVRFNFPAWQPLFCVGGNDGGQVTELLEKVPRGGKGKTFYCTYTFFCVALSSAQPLCSSVGVNDSADNDNAIVRSWLKIHWGNHFFFLYCWKGLKKCLQLAKTLNI